MSLYTVSNASANDVNIKGVGKVPARGTKGVDRLTPGLTAAVAQGKVTISGTGLQSFSLTALTWSALSGYNTNNTMENFNNTFDATSAGSIRKNLAILASRLEILENTVAPSMAKLHDQAFMSNN
jgi:hypothetical protein